MLEDHEILFSSIKNYHPTPFMYTSEQEYTAFYNNQRSEFPHSLTEMDFNIISKNKRRDGKARRLACMDYQPL